MDKLTFICMPALMLLVTHLATSALDEVSLLTLAVQDN